MILPKPQLLEWGSKLQIQSIGLRYEVLRKPLGLCFAPEELLQEETQWHIGMVSGERVEGILLIKFIGENVAKMRQVAVAESFQGKGIGKEMVRYAELLCSQNHIEKIELHARKSAVPFYLSLGYHTEGAEFEEVGIPHIKMSIKL
jgi:predicted GNAT family N-acyltransferase